MLTRKLDLKRETLTALTTEEMVAVAAAGGGTGPQPTPPQHVPNTLDLQVCLNTVVNC